MQPQLLFRLSFNLPPSEQPTSDQPPPDQPLLSTHLSTG
jgi:hypothetical protein